MWTTFQRSIEMSAKLRLFTHYLERQLPCRSESVRQVHDNPDNSGFWILAGNPRANASESKVSSEKERLLAIWTSGLRPDEMMT